MNKQPLRSPACCLSVALICLIAVPVQGIHAQSSPADSPATRASLVNPDFEEGSVGRAPDGWRSSASSADYEAKVVEGNPKTGRRAALLQSVSATQADARAFGNLMQAIDAAPLRGRRVRFRAAVRVEGDAAGAQAQLWLRVDRAGKQMGFFDNMDDRPVTSGAWQYHEIVGDVAEDAAVVNLGLLLLGKGRAWLDDVSLADLGRPVTSAEPARPLSKRGLENLIAFTRLLGYVRHFYPSDEAAAADWNVFAVEGVRAVEEATDAADLARKLETLFRPLAPNLRVFPTGRRPAPA